MSDLPSFKHVAADPATIAQTIPATVIRLPSADGEAVQQHPPRGRRPKHVLSLWRARLDRSQVVTVLALQAQLALVQQTQDECNARAEVAWANLKEAERLDKLIDAELRVLGQQIKSIKAQLAQAAKGAA